MILECNSIAKSFKKTTVLKDINLSLKRGEILTLLGDSGCGKSTLLRIFAGLETSDQGTIKIDKTLVADKNHFLSPQKREIAFVFQDYALFPHMNVKQNISFALKDTPNKYKDKLIHDVSKTLNILPLLKRNPHELSGGQQQRIAIARALVLKPHLLLLDEPFSNLDTNLKISVSLELREIIKSLNIGAIMVTHNRSEALSMSDNIAILHEGVIEQCSNPKDIYLNPKSKHVAKFMGEISIIKQDNKTIGVRPESCSFSFEKGDYKSKVTNTIFTGSHQMIHLHLQDINQNIKVQANRNLKVGIGDEGYVNIDEFVEFKN